MSIEKLKFTKEQQRVYNSITYDWECFKGTKKEKEILNKLINCDLVEVRLGIDCETIYYRRANKRIMVG